MSAWLIQEDGLGARAAGFLTRPRAVSTTQVLVCRPPVGSSGYIAHSRFAAGCEQRKPDDGSCANAIFSID
jgi:hypothetical protein